mmetsp:Transcript_24269/g.23323  ORF Transcript_24269/g.23323 Transcript_24269/m.23323 type:complete len:136 (+) Transcript_24269:230-637(+)
MASVQVDVQPAINSDVHIPRKYMDRTTKLVLLQIFSELSAHKWTVAIRNFKFREFLKLTQFLEFNRGQIKRVYDLYECTLNLKKLIASLVVSKTGEKMADSALSVSIESMIGIDTVGLLNADDNENTFSALRSRC